MNSDWHLPKWIQVSTMSYTQARVNQLSRKDMTVHSLKELQMKHNCKVAQRVKDPRITKIINRLINKINYSESVWKKSLGYNRVPWNISPNWKVKSCPQWYLWYRRSANDYWLNLYQSIQHNFRWQQQHPCHVWWLESLWSLHHQGWTLNINVRGYHQR